MIDQELTNRNKALVLSFYQSGTDSEAETYGGIFLPEFKVTAPDYLPWGGTSDLTAYLDNVLPQVTAVIEFSRCEVVSLVAENEKVVILVNLGLVGTTYATKISEHWEIKDGKALSLWVAYFEPKNLMDLIARNATA
jgi:hypothetical protein